MIKRITLGLIFFVLGAFVANQSSFAVITGSAHDFSNQSFWNPSHEICNVCHTPHNASSTIAPLWNHQLSSATYTLYSSPTLNATPGQPGPSSKACLSCHDGTVALDSYGGRVGTNFNIGRYGLGTDLSNDHPVSFTYDPALATADGGLYDPTVQTVPALGNRTIDNGMLVGHKLECISCHDVHADKGYSGMRGGHLILVTNYNSALCLTCHRK